MAATNERRLVRARAQRVRRLCLVTGGSGFLGRYLVEALLKEGHEVRIFDVAPPSWDCSGIEVISGDVCDGGAVSEACRGVHTVFHTAADAAAWGPNSRFYSVNVIGTQNVVDGCLSQRVPQLIFTSTASVCIDGSDIKNGDEEQLGYPKRHLDAYSATKAMAEKLVLAANGAPFPRSVENKGTSSPSSSHPELSGVVPHETLSSASTPNDDNEEIGEDSRLLTIALRPHAMFGPRDTHFLSKLVDRARGGDITHLVGDGQNVADFTYVENVVYAHLLARRRLVPGAPCAGNAYFITNGEPRKFWEFINSMLSELGCVGPTKSIAYAVAYPLALLMEFIQHVAGRFGWWFKPTITRHMVCAMSKHHWFSNARAARDLGYSPPVTLERGLALTCDYFHRQASRRQAEAVAAARRLQTGPSAPLLGLWSRTSMLSLAGLGERLSGNANPNNGSRSGNTSAHQSPQLSTRTIPRSLSSALLNQTTYTHKSAPPSPGHGVSSTSMSMLSSHTQKVHSSNNFLSLIPNSSPPPSSATVARHLTYPHSGTSTSSSSTPSSVSSSTPSIPGVSSSSSTTHALVESSSIDDLSDGS